MLAEGKPEVNLSQCTAFVAIADTGSFTEAAKALAISQSAVSHAISSLEKALGVALMKRSRSGVEFTDVGQRILGHARAVVLGAERMRQEAEAQLGNRSGTIRIGTSQSFAARLLPRLLTDFRGAWPDTEIVLREGTDQQIAEWLDASAIDVGVVNLPKENLTTVPLLQDEMFVVLPPGHPLAGQAAVRVEELADEVFILPVGGVEPVLRRVFAAVGRRPRTGFQVHEVNGLLSMVAEGHGITVVPALALPSVLPHPGLRTVPFAPALTRSIGIGTRSGAHRSPAARDLVAMARALVGDGTRTHRPDRGPDAVAAVDAARTQPTWRQGDPGRSAAMARSSSPSGPAARVSAWPAMASAS